MINIESRAHTYSVHFINRGELIRILENYDLCIIDENVAKVHPLIANIEHKVLFLPIESEKNMASVLEILEKFNYLGLNRKSKILCLGGGILQDICTMACSIFMRGIEWDFVPTTLQAMTDSCIGGKSSINLGSRKNLIGNYHPPKNIFIDSTLISTLNYEDIQCGFMEMLKINMLEESARLETFFVLFRSIIGKSASAIDSNILEKLLLSTLQIKSTIVTEDEFDLGLRKLLNFGHTFGHAIEEISNLEIPHGHAVGLGMMCATKYSTDIEKSFLSERFSILLELIKEVFESYDKKFYSEYLRSLPYEQLSEKMLGDKKTVRKQISLIIPVSDNLVLFETKFDYLFVEAIKKTLIGVSIELEN